MRQQATQTPAYLELASGHVFPARSFGYEQPVSGETVFQTGMVGYPESLTDPSYAGQILVLTYPLIGNYGAPDHTKTDDAGIPLYAESYKIHPAALIVSDYTHDYSHWNAASSLSQWLIDNQIPALTGIDTRRLTMIIRETGTVLARIIIGSTSRPPPDFVDPNLRNLVADVSTSNVRDIPGLNNHPDAPSIVMLDCGMKNNQLRALRKRARRVLVVPWNTKLAEFEDSCDGLFISNGPGDPAMASETVQELKDAMQRRPGRPIFGICLGHQLLARAAGFNTYKLKYGNRGHNQPCIELSTGRCHITSQNHGYAVRTGDPDTSSDWLPTFINANDGTNEGIAHRRLPYFSVQFHPEASAGPHDTEYLFDTFIKSASVFRTGGVSDSLFDFSAVLRRLRNDFGNGMVPLSRPKSLPTIKKVIVLGSGGLSIGQAGEFDYSGSQAIKALKSQSVQTVLVNPNIATVQTSPGLADKVYYLPVTPDNVLKVIENERPDGILMTFGGQTALNCGVKLYESGDLERMGVKVLGTPVEAILDTEDRERFNSRLAEIDEPFADSRACKSIEECVKAAEAVGYPVILRAAFALGGLGSGFAENSDELSALACKAFTSSSQVLVERSMKGWKEVEYEVVRDAYNNCITVCNMENFDPLGIHTGDSIVVAPSQTLSDAEYHMLRDAALRTVRHLGVVGECNIQYALNPHSLQYCIIEVNARLSRSSALASKATGYPLAFVAAHLALGIPLPEIRNSVTKETTACFEPSLDYLAVKVPRWDLKKFSKVSRSLGSSMKSVGEVMSLGRTFEEAIQKAIRMARDNYVSGFEAGVVPYSEDAMRNPTDERLLAIADGLANGITAERIHELTKIDMWFLKKLERISKFEDSLSSRNQLSYEEMLSAKELGFSDRQIARLTKETELAVRKQRTSQGIRPSVKQIDTVAAEFPARTNYLYTTYANASTLSVAESLKLSGSERMDTAHIFDDITFDEHGVIVLGSGAYRIGSSVEFDNCAVAATRTLRKERVHSIMINYNPETVSTDYDECDRLYFEELSFERVLDIYNLERSKGIIVSMGGQLANNIAMALHRQAARILGTTPEMIDSAENRYKFSRMCDRNAVDQPKWKELSSIGDAKAFCEDVGYPVLVRPSYVLSGAAMNVAHKAEDLEAYLSEAAMVSPDCPVVISKFILEAKEIEVDAVVDKGELVMHVISEHVENAGVHSGDATLVLPPQDLDEITVRKVESATAKVAQALNVTGPMNIQFIAKDNEIKVIECNLRASRTFPFVSKTIGMDLAETATRVMLGRPVTKYPVDVSKVPFVGVKVAQFSFTRLLGADPILGVEMASTGEVACFGASKEEAYLKGLTATTKPPPKTTVAVSIGTYKEKLEFLDSAKRLKHIGMKLIATPGTADFFQEHKIDCEVAVWSSKNEYSASEEENTIENMLRDGRVEFFINIPSNNKYRRLASFESQGYHSRRASVDFSVPLLTNIKCAKLFVKVMELIHRNGRSLPLGPYDSRFSSRVVTLPGLVMVDLPVDDTFSSVSSKKTGIPQTVSSVTGHALEGGFALVGLSFSRDKCSEPEQFLNLLQESKAQAFCNFSLYVTAKPGNAAVVRPLAGKSAGLKISPEETEQRHDSAVETWMTYFQTWPKGTPVVLNASGSSLAALLFAAVVSSRQVHITQVRRREDIVLIETSKLKGISISCDVNVLDLYANDVSGRMKRKDQEALWEHLETVDAVTGPPNLIIPLLLSSVFAGRISMEWIRSRLYERPARILGLENVLPRSSIEVDVDEIWEGAAASDVAGVPLRGKVRRVVQGDKVHFLDDKIWAVPGSGENVSIKAVVKQTTPITEASHEVSRPALQDPTSPAAPQSQVMETSISLAPDISGQKSLAPTKNATDMMMPWDVMSMRTSAENVSSPLHTDRSIDSVRTESEDVSTSKLMNGSLKSMYQPKTASAIPTVPETLPGYGSGWWAGRHILSVSQFGRHDLHKLFEVAQEMRTMVSRVGHYDLLRGKVMASLFYEPSTRTSCSFQAAMQRLGGTVLNIQDVSNSSISKGETLSDTIQTLSCYSDIIVLRHPDVGSAQEAAAVSRLPILNAGDGIGEHPTQALLDVFTIREELGTVNGLTVTFVGDLKNGRTVHSLARVLAEYSVRVRYVSPETLRVPSELLEELASRGIEQKEYKELNDEVMRETDVLYVTRVQQERFDNEEEYERAKGAYMITPKTLTKAKENMVVMHPLPRNGEISQDVDSDPRAVYFRQMEHGIYVRMALLAMVLGKN